MLERSGISDILEFQLPPSDNYRIYYEKLSLSGLEEMHNYSKDERFYEFLEFKPFTNIEETKEYIKKLLERMKKIDNLINCSYWFIRDKENKNLIGTAGLLNLDYERSSVEWGFGIDPNLWGLGYILEIEETLKHFVFEKLKLNRLYGKTMINNKRTIDSLIATGMINEGIAKDFYCKNNKFIDAWLYALTKKDYINQLKNVVRNTNAELNEIVKIVQKIIFQSEVDINTSMENNLDWDSMNHMLIISAIEDKFNLKFTPSEITKATSIRKINDII